LVSYGTKIYDPSYGASYASMAAFETAATAGFVLERTLDEDAVGVKADLNGDGKIDNTAVRVFLFRKNLPVQDLI